MNVLFFTSNTGFPIERNGSRFMPRPCVGGFIFADEPIKREICDELGITYEIKPIDQIEFPPPPPDEIIDEP